MLVSHFQCTRIGRIGGSNRHEIPRIEILPHFFLVANFIYAHRRCRGDTTADLNSYRMEGSCGAGHAPVRRVKERDWLRFFDITRNQIAVFWLRHFPIFQFANETQRNKTRTNRDSKYSNFHVQDFRSGSDFLPARLSRNEWPAAATHTNTESDRDACWQTVLTLVG